MEKNTRTTIITCGSIAAAVVVFIVVSAIVTGRWIWEKAEAGIPDISYNEQTEVGLSATQVQSIIDIDQWEFLSVTDEEMVDTMRSGLFFDDHLVCIYYGTLRLGINMQRLDTSRLQLKGDTLAIVLPQPTLLDNDFIDDARTQIFHEVGDWPSSARNDLYARAKARMQQRALTTANMVRTREMATMQMQQLLQAMGYGYVEVAFEDDLSR